MRRFRMVALVLVVAAAIVSFLRSEIPAPTGTLVLREVQGRGSIHAADGSSRPWRAGTLLATGDVIATEDGQALVSGGTALQMVVGPSTRLALSSLVQRRVGNELRADVELEEGRAALAAADTTSVRVSSPVGRADVVGGAVEVGRAGDAMRVVSLKGRASYASRFMANVQYALREGEELVADGERGEHEIKQLKRLDGWQQRALQKL